jgi:RNA polymerase sigma factor (TIGR02999 family)
MAQEAPGQTLQATALVHEAYLRLVDTDQAQHWNSRGHFFAAAAEAMRRILVESARPKQSHKHGGGLVYQDADPDAFPVANPRDPLEVLAVHELLDRLAQKSPRKAELVKLRYFLGYTVAEAAQILGVTPATAEEDWTGGGSGPRSPPPSCSPVVSTCGADTRWRGGRADCRAFADAGPLRQRESYALSAFSTLR